MVQVLLGSLQSGDKQATGVDMGEEGERGEKG